MSWLPLIPQAPLCTEVGDDPKADKAADANKADGKRERDRFGA